MDRWLKQAWLPLLALLVGLVAYLQARGLSSLLAASLHERPLVRAVRPTAALEAGPEVTADTILERNPFDSVTGPLDGSHQEELETDQEVRAEVRPTGDPLQDPTCDFADVTMTVVLREPARSFAGVVEKGGDSKLVQVGGRVGGHTLSRVGSDRAWLRKGSDRCQMRLFDDVQVGKRKKPAKRTTKPKRRSRRSSTTLPKSIADKINKVSDTEFNVERSIVDEILGQQAKLMRTVRFRPQREGGEVVGMRVSRVRGGSLLGSVGIKSGDVIHSINGFSVSDPQKALEAYGKLRMASNVSVKVTRAGKPVTIQLNIQ